VPVSTIELANVVELLSAPAVSVEVVAAALLVTVVPDTPASEPIEVLNEFRSSVEVPFNVTALLADNAFAAPTFSVPELFTVVAPEYVFAPLNVSVPVPAFVSPVALVPSWITPAYVVELLSPPAVSVAAAATPLLVTVVVPDALASEPIV
jgi:hypothetical protein